MTREQLKTQLLSNIEDILDIITEGSTAEIKKNKEGVQVFEVNKKKLKKY